MTAPEGIKRARFLYSLRMPERAAVELNKTSVGSTSLKPEARSKIQIDRGAVGRCITREVELF